MSPSHQWYGVVPGWLAFYALIAVALVLFTRRAIFLLRLMRAGKPAARWDKVPQRLVAVLVYVFGQARLLQNFGLMITDLVADAGRIVRAPTPSDHWQFAGSALASLLAHLPPGAVTAVFHVSWWLHAVLLLGFLVYLPYSKHLHIMAAPFNVFFASQKPKGQFQTINLEEAETFGVGS